MMQKRVLPVRGFPSLGTEVWELPATAAPIVHICIVPGNPGAAGVVQRLRKGVLLHNYVLRGIHRAEFAEAFSHAMPLCTVLPTAAVQLAL